MSITGKQLKLAIEEAAACASGGLQGPTATFSAVPSAYTNISLPAGVTLSGAITLNDAAITLWNIKQGNTVLATGSTLVPSFYVSPPPSVTTVYTLEVYYTLDGEPGILTLNATVTVTDGALYGHLPDVVTDITIPADLTAPIIATLSVADFATITSLFTVTVTTPSRVVIVVPYSFGTGWSVVDNDNFIVDSEFTFVDDPGNNQMIAVMNNPVISGNFLFKITFP